MSAERKLYAVDVDEKYPVYELVGEHAGGPLALTELEYQDYLEVVERYGSWQERLSNAFALPSKEVISHER